MATIEKEKALDVVRQMVADGQVSQEVAEKYFPELRESEDEKMINKLIAVVELYYGIGDDLDKQRCLSWLNSLKDRYTWKPSDEQMEALANALSLAKNCGEEYSFDLRTLYEQLKKLKE